MRPLKNSQSVRAISFALIILCVAGLSAFPMLYQSKEPIEKNIVILVGSATGCLFAAVVFVFYGDSRLALPIAHTVAVLGWPRSGKTTLIVALFREIFAQKVGKNSFKIGISGSSTIDKVNDAILRLETGQGLGPTEDKDRFSYQTNISRKGLLTRRYKIEIGDFPGEDSLRYMEKYGPWLHTTEFFKWTMEADCVVFVVDCAKMCASSLDLSEKNDFLPRNDNERSDGSVDYGYTASISSAIRAAWQHLADYSRLANEAPRQRSVILVFTKLDVIYTGSKTLSKDQYSHPTFITKEDAQRLTDFCINHGFIDLVNFLSSESNRFTVIGLSPYLITEGGLRVGFDKLFKAVLP